MTIDISSVRHPDDRKVLAQLIAQGDPLTPVRHTIAYFSITRPDPGETALGALGKRAIENLWLAKRSGARGLALESNHSVDPVSVNALRDQMEAWSKEFGVDFDGWETTVVIVKKKQ